MSLPWYHTTSIYHIYPRSFYDSNGDGIGDLPGILQKLDYLQALGFETLWLSPFFASPQADFGYDISDFTDIAPEYGTLEDVLELIAEVHRRGMKIVLDLVLNHTSDQHPWFKESRASRDNPKADWYLWRDKPNNWQSITGGSGWHYAAERGQYYWASFLPFQPDLNHRNPEVRRTMFDIARYWLGKGVDGFRLDIINVIYKDAAFRNNPFAFSLFPSEEEPVGFLQRARHTLNQPENYNFVKELRRVTEEFGEKLTIGEVTRGSKIAQQFLGCEVNDGLTLVFDFGMLRFRFRADYFHRLIADMETRYPAPFMPVYVFSNLDKPRSFHNLGNDLRKAKLLALFQLTVRGVPCLYYGEEIGMTNSFFPFGTALDPIPHKYTFVPRFIFDRLGIQINRDEVRTPMQWDATRNAGFSSAAQTWLPVHETYTEVNVAQQMQAETSLLNTFRMLMKLRKQEPALLEGSLELLERLPAHVLGYARKLHNEKIFALLNFSSKRTMFEFQNAEVLFRLSAHDSQNGKTVQLDSFGGMILKQPASSKAAT